MHNFRFIFLFWGYTVFDDLQFQKLLIFVITGLNSHTFFLCRLQRLHIQNIALQFYIVLLIII